MIEKRKWNHPRLKSEHIILVEGKDEVNLLEKLLEAANIESIQVIDAGGKDQFPSRLAVILADARVNDVDLKCVGIIRDADNDCEGAFSSIQNVLRSEGLPVPTSAGTIAQGNINTTILILPDESTQGAIEDLCWKSIETLTAASCVDSYVECLQQNSALASSNLSKTKVHAFLASQEDPTTSVGLGAVKGYWPLDNDAFNIIREFIVAVDNC